MCASEGTFSSFYYFKHRDQYLFFYVYKLKGGLPYNTECLCYWQGTIQASYAVMRQLLFLKYLNFGVNVLIKNMLHFVLIIHRLYFDKCHCFVGGQALGLGQIIYRGDLRTTHPVGEK